MNLVLIQSNIVSRTSSGGGKYDSLCSIWLFFDNETKVEYFIMNTYDGSAICPRIGKDGKPIIYIQK